MKFYLSYSFISVAISPLINLYTYQLVVVNSLDRNADMSCDDGIIAKMDLTPWKTASPHFVIPDTLLEESVVRAKREVEDYLIQEETLQLTAGK